MTGTKSRVDDPTDSAKLSGDGTLRPNGWIFISYRHSEEGFRYASEIAALLRVVGFHVWLDVDCMTVGPVDDGLRRGVAPYELIGESATSLNQAKGDTIIGGVLVLTEDVKASTIVKNLEFPALVEGYSGNGFALAIANALPKVNGEMDRDSGPAEVFKGSRHVPDGRYMHYDLHDRRGLMMLVSQMCTLLRGALAARLKEEQGVLKCHVQTRVERHSHLYADDAALHVGMKWSEDLWPDRDDLRRFISLAAEHRTFVDVCGGRVEFSGGIHESVALALGAIHARRNAVSYRDSEGQVWSGKSSSQVALPARRYQHEATLVGPEELADVQPYLRPPGQERGRVACWVTLSPVPQHKPFTVFIEGNSGYFDRAVRLRLQDMDRWVSPAEADGLVSSLAQTVRELAEDNSEIHLAFQGPAGLALLLGEKLAMVDVVVYEYDKEYPGKYGPVLSIRWGNRTRMKVLDPDAPLLEQDPFNFTDAGLAP